MLEILVVVVVVVAVDVAIALCAVYRWSLLTAVFVYECMRIGKNTHLVREMTRSQWQLMNVA